MRSSPKEDTFGLDAAANNHHELAAEKRNFENHDCERPRLKRGQCVVAYDGLGLLSTSGRKINLSSFVSNFQSGRRG